MPESGDARVALPRTFRRFAADAALLMRLIIEDRALRGACDDYELSSATLARLAERPGNEAVVADYREIIVELEREIEGRLALSRRRVSEPRPRDATE